MVVLDGDPMLLAKLFKCGLAFHGVLQVNGFLELDETEAGCLVNVDSCMVVPLAGWFA